MTAGAGADVGDTVTRLAWGWIATLRPTKAARLLGVPTSTLRYWSDRGLITCIRNGPGRERRYLEAEIALVRMIVGYDYTPQLRTLVEHLEELLGGGL
jgi:DNA-binding transcriptional MerR regulator